MDHNDIEIFQQETVYQGHFCLEQYHLRFRLFAGGWSQPIVRELFVRSPCVALLPYDPVADNVVLIQQFRIGAIKGTQSPWLHEIIAGVIDQNETAEAVAIREAHEEAGLILSDVKPIYTYWSSPGGSTEQVSLFYATVDSTQVRGIHGLIAEGEDIKVNVMSRSEAFAAVEIGLINNATAILALQWLQLNYKFLCKI